jgi:hypothetical protein
VNIYPNVEAATTVLSMNKIIDLNHEIIALNHEIIALNHEIIALNHEGFLLALQCGFVRSAIHSAAEAISHSLVQWSDTSAERPSCLKRPKGLRDVAFGCSVYHAEFVGEGVPGTGDLPFCD